VGSGDQVCEDKARVVRLTSNCGLMRFDAGTALSCHKPRLTAHLKASAVLYRSVQSKSLELEPERRSCRSCSEAPRKLTRSMSRRYWLNSATRQKRRMSAIGCVALCIAKVAAFSLHSLQAKVIGLVSAELVPYFPTGSTICRVTALVVSTHHRGRRVGEKLVAGAVDFARQHHCSGIEITSAEHRLDAHRFYQRLGFSRTSSRFFQAL
jgi:GNAT superfamily N-acetyltransferase